MATISAEKKGKRRGWQRWEKFSLKGRKGEEEFPDLITFVKTQVTSEKHNNLLGPG